MADEIRGRRERRHLPRAALVVVAVLVTVSAAGDRWQLGRERADLVRCVEDGTSAVRYVDRQIQAIVQYASPQLRGAGVPEPVRQSLMRLVQDTARNALPTLRGASAGCKRGDLLPWHEAQREARRAVAAYLDAERRRVQAAAEDLDTLGEPVQGITGLQKTASRAVTAALTGEQAKRARRQLTP